MNKLLLCSLLMVFAIGPTQGQTIIKINPTNGQPDMELANRIKKGTFYRIQIDGINPNLYKISINSTDTVLSKALQTPMPAGGGIDVDALSKLLGNVVLTGTTISSTLDAGTESYKIHENRVAKSAKVDRPTTTVNQIIDQERSAVNNLKNQIITSATDIDKLRLEANGYRLSAISTNNVSGNINYQALLKKFETEKDKLAAVQRSIMQLQRDYEQNIRDFQDVVANDEVLKKSDSAIRAMHELLLKMVADAATAVSADKLYELLSKLVIIENNRSNTYLSWPIQFNGEQTRVVITATPRSEELAGHSFATTLVFPGHQKSYAAVGLSYYGASLYNEVYSTQTTITNTQGPTAPVSDTSYSIVREDVTKAEMGVAALLRYGRKMGAPDDNFGIHASIGGGVTLTNQIRPRLLLGGGFSFGKTHMFTMDFGLIAGYTDQLRSSITDTIGLAIKPESTTISRLKVGLFGSVGYLYRF